jgi:hypothetical protein
VANISGDLQTQIDNISGAEAGEGVINYIENGGFEDLSTTGWSTYNDGAVSVPVNGKCLFCAPNITFSAITSVVLRGNASGLILKDAVNRQGEGVSYDFDIDAADKNKQLSISLDVDASNNYDSGDLTVWVYDVTNSVICPMGSDNFIPGTGTHKITFGTSTSTSYRLIIHISGTNASDWGVYIDGITVGPQEVTASAVVTDGVDFTPTIVGATLSSADGKWRRVGNWMECWQTGIVSSVTDFLRLQLPPGYSLDLDALSSIDDTILGYAFAEDVGVGRYLGTVYVVGSNIVISSDGSSVAWGPAAPMTWASGDKIYFRFTVPIQGWEANQVTQPGSTFKWAEKFGSSAVRVTSTPSAPGEYRAYIKNASSKSGLGTDTTPTNLPSSSDGFRIYSESYANAGTSGEPNAYIIFVGKNKNVSFEYYSGAGRTGSFYSDLTSVKLDANDLLEYGIAALYVPDTGVVIIDASLCSTTQNDARYTGLTTSGNPLSDGRFDIIVSDNPQALAVEKNAYVIATSDSGQSIATTGTDLIFENVTLDSHGIYNTSTGSATAPFDSVAVVDMQFETDSIASDSFSNCTLDVNGTIVYSKKQRVTLATGRVVGSINAKFAVVAGDRITVAAATPVGPVSLRTDDVYNRLSITFEPRG